MEQNAGGAPVEPVEKRRSLQKWRLPHAVVMQNEKEKSIMGQSSKTPKFKSVRRTGTGAAAEGI
jgi:hypothetical protein